MAVPLKSPEVPALGRGEERRRMNTDCHPAAQEVTANQNAPGEKVSFPKWVSRALCSLTESVTRGTWTEWKQSLERGQITPSFGSAAPLSSCPPPLALWLPELLESSNSHFYHSVNTKSQWQETDFLFKWKLFSKFQERESSRTF